jgi:hypothetical protein
MYAAFIINILIIALIMVAICATGNPLFILALLLLQNMPFLMPEQENPDEYPEQPMGFNAKVE